jgi:ribosomal protein RSM22 (predicted rRNA methylase)
MTLPDFLSSSLEKIAESHFTTKVLAHSYSQMRKRYLHSSESDLKKQIKSFKNSSEQVAYLLARMPATYAAIHSVLHQLRSFDVVFKPSTVWDLGCGPGTGSWAASSLFSSIENFIFVEKDPRVLDFCQKLVKSSPDLSLKKSTYHAVDLKNIFQISGAADLVILSYCMGELDRKKRLQVLEESWSRCQHYYILIEPSTPFAFEIMKEMRTFLLQKGGYLVAPCPHEENCPIVAPSWCHFSKRLERSSLHRRIKQGSLPYEEEKFIYWIFSKNPFFKQSGFRVLSPSIKRSGFVELSLCTPEGNREKKIISRREKNLYQRLRKTGWGDFIPQDILN